MKNVSEMEKKLCNFELFDKRQLEMALMKCVSVRSLPKRRSKHWHHLQRDAHPEASYRVWRRHRCAAPECIRHFRFC